jgi:tRNA (mo5U34)-methyltransferase
MTQGIPQLRAQRTVRAGPVDVTVSIPIDLADRLRNGVVYRRLLRPALAGRDRTPTVAARPRQRVEPIGPEARALWQRIGAVDWYHTIDLGHGVATPGVVDLRDQVPLYGLPDSLAGQRVLDLCTFDGFWAFELERRGAEVVALDPTGAGDVSSPLRSPGAAGRRAGTGPDAFVLARAILGLSVEWIEGSLYDLDPQRTGTFDLVLVSDVLRRLRCPQRAIESAAGVCRGDIVVADVFTRKLEGVSGLAIAEYTADGGSWWAPNVKTFAGMMTVAGCEPIEELARFRIDRRARRPREKVVLRGQVDTDPVWLRELRAWAEKTPPKWKSAAEEQP